MMIKDTVKANFSNLLIISFVSSFLIIFIWGLFLINFIHSDIKDYFPLLVLIFFSILTIFFSITKPLKSVYFLITIFAFQTLFSMIVSNFMETSIGIKILLMVKEICAVLILFIFLLYNLRKIFSLYIEEYLMIILVIISFFYLFLPKGGSFFAKIVSFREILMIFVLYFIGRFLPIEKFDTIYQYIKFVFKITFIVILFGFIEFFFFPKDVWYLLGNIRFFQIKFSNAFFDLLTINGFPAHWYTYLEDDVLIRRMVSSIGDATSLSRFISFSTVISLMFFLHKKNSIYLLLFILFFTANILTFGRGGILIVVISFITFLIKNYLKTGLVFAMILFAFIINTPLFSIESGVFFRHFTGLLKGISAAIENPFGKGLGSAGEMAIIYSGNEVMERVEESFWGAIGYQLGSIGLLLYFTIFLLLIYRLNIIFGELKQLRCLAPIYISSLSFSLGIFLTSALAQSAVAPISAGLHLIFIGLSINIYTFLKRNKGGSIQ